MKASKMQKGPVQAEALRGWLLATGAANLPGGHLAREATLRGRQLILHGEIQLPKMLLPTEDHLLERFLRCSSKREEYRGSLELSPIASLGTSVKNKEDQVF